MKHQLLPGKTTLVLAAIGSFLAAGAVTTLNAPERFSAAQEATVSVKMQPATKSVKRPLRKLPDNFSRNASTNELTFVAPSGRVKYREASAGSFHEGFEGWDGETPNWIPEGWSVISNSDENVPDISKWGADEPAAYKGMLPDAPEGSYTMAITYDFDGFDQDETLVSPKISISENQVLTFQCYCVPFFFFDDENFDYDTFDFDGDRVIKGDLEVLVREGDGEFRKVWSMMEQFLDVPADELYSRMFVKNTVNLSEFSGKEINLGFRYYGHDCDMLMIDDINVSLPTLEDISYAYPFSALYWGFDRSEGWGALNVPLALMPVLAPVTWNNTSEDVATFSWEYMASATDNTLLTSDDQYELTVEYTPDFSTPSTSRNNVLRAPVLKARAEGTSEATYQSPVTNFQAGGAPERIFEAEDKNQPADTLRTTLFPFDYHTDGYTFFTVFDDKIGDPAIPVFGYNANTDAYWLDYFLDGEEPSAGDYSRLTAILNFITPPTAPLVVTGSTVYAAGKVPASSDIEFKIEIIPLSEEGALDTDILPPVATATVTADKIIHSDYGSNDLLTIPFDFEKPVIIIDEGHSYVVRFSGFHNPAIEYFVPLQSEIPFATQYCIGWYQRENKAAGFERGVSLSPMAYISGPYGPQFGAFGIGLDGFYPYLTADTEEVEVYSDGSPSEYKLGSYYAGEEYEISAPTGVQAEVTGRYGDTRLILRHDDTEVIAEGTLTLKAPGVERTFRVNQTNGMNPLAGSSRTVTGIYTADGKKVASPEKGIYIIRYSDGRSAKVRF